MDNGGFSPQELSKPRPENYELKWHNFLIYFALWAGGVMNVINGIQAITGSHYNGLAAQVYDRFPGIHGTDLVFGLCLLATAGFAVYTRYQLAGFRMGAPTKLLILYGVNTVLPLVYLFVVSGVSGAPIRELTDFSTFSSLAVSVGMIFANKTYYDKRIELFIY